MKIYLVAGVLMLSGVVLAGCDNKGASNANAPGAVAVVDTAKLAGELRWGEDISERGRKDKEFAEQQLGAFKAFLTKQVADRKAQIAEKLPAGKREEFLKSRDDVAEWDRLGVPKEQQQELAIVLNNANQYLNQAFQGYNQLLPQRQMDLNRQYRLIMQSPVRQVAEENHFTVVLMTPTDGVLYSSPLVDITGKVADKLREQKPLPPSIPDLTPLQVPSNLLTATMTTQPATMPATH